MGGPAKGRCWLSMGGMQDLYPRTICTGPLEGPYQTRIDACADGL